MWWLFGNRMNPKHAIPPSTAATTIKCIWFKTSKSSKKQNSSTDKQHKSNQQEEDKASEENLVQQAWQKQRESEQLKMNPKEILKEKMNPKKEHPPCPPCICC
jgi:hypothetical protein